MRRCVVTDYTFANVAAERAAAFENGATFEAHRTVPAGDVARLVRDADVAVVQDAPVDAEAIAALAPGATVLRYGSDVDTIDIEAAHAAGVKVGYAPDYCVEEMAEHTVASLLTLLRKLPGLDRSVRSGAWDAVAVARPIRPFAETTVGFFGFGRIGRAVWGKLRGLGFSAIVADPALGPVEANAHGVDRAEAATVFAEADAVTLHAAVTEDTAGYVNADRLASMRSHAVIVNTAAGALVVEEDLAAALYAGTIAGAALDSFVKEPLPVGSPLLQAANCLITPNAAWYSDTAIARLQAMVAEDIGRALNGEPPRCPVRFVNNEETAS
ncbi:MULTISPECIES: C-terminal binding protein [unclassified Roseitalea]|uniref:C-terminal binding protein n=1 Tax=unclassified Roseitalea TaxID=2639107 RepID=UPI00273FDA40|nr:MULTISPECIES: C-terminal binding protein [unclassified Roseitalea]